MSHLFDSFHVHARHFGIVMKDNSINARLKLKKWVNVSSRKSKVYFVKDIWDSRNELHLVSSQNTKYEQKSHRNLGSSPSRISYLPLRDLIRFTTAKNPARTEKINRRSTVAKRAKILKEDPSYMNPINYPPQKIERRFSEEEPPSLSNHFSQRGKQTIPC